MVFQRKIGFVVEYVKRRGSGSLNDGYISRQANPNEDKLAEINCNHNCKAIINCKN